VPSEPLGVLLISGNHERAHYAFVVAAGAAALGRDVVLFATNEGCRALLSDWSSLADAAREEAVVARGVAGLAELRDAATEFGVRMIACEAGLRIAGIDPGTLTASVEVAGVASFLEAVRGGQVITL
jgi:peroxiredoxin family protein